MYCCFLFGLDVLLLLWYLFSCFYCFKGCHQGERYASKRSSSQCNTDGSFWILGCTITKDVLYNSLILQVLLKLSLPFTITIWRFLSDLVAKGTYARLWCINGEFFLGNGLGAFPCMHASLRDWYYHFAHETIVPILKVVKRLEGL